MGGEVKQAWSRKERRKSRGGQELEEPSVELKDIGQIYALPSGEGKVINVVTPLGGPGVQVIRVR